MGKISGSCGAVTKDLTFMSWDLKKEEKEKRRKRRKRRKKEEDRKVLAEIMAESFLNLAKDITTYSRS